MSRRNDVMSDTPKFTVVDRRKFRGDEESAAPAEQEQSSTKAAVADAPEEPAQTGPRLTLVEPPPRDADSGGKAAIAAAEGSADGNAAKTGAGLAAVSNGSAQTPSAPATPSGVEESIGEDESDLPPAPSPEESRFQKLAYDQAAERLEDLVRAQNPAAPPAEKIGFEHLVQQLYLSAMMQMGAGTPEGQRPRVDILGARQTIDLLGVVADKTEGKLSPIEIRTLDTVLYELRLTFLELTRMVTQPQVPPPPGPKR